MNILFIYEVNGTKFEGYEPWGDAWKKAEELATTYHAPITRQVIKGEKIRNEFFAIGGMFLNEKSYRPEIVFIF